MSVGRLRATVLLRCPLCVHREGVLAEECLLMCGVSDDWCAGFRVVG